MKVGDKMKGKTERREREEREKKERARERERERESERECVCEREGERQCQSGMREDNVCERICTFRTYYTVEMSDYVYILLTI
jgi:hypothetical protein